MKEEEMSCKKNGSKVIAEGSCSIKKTTLMKEQSSEELKYMLEEKGRTIIIEFD